MRTVQTDVPRRRDQPRRAGAGRMATASEASLLERLRAGEQSAFEEWVRAETPRVLGTLRRILRNEEDAQDATQDAFLQAYRALGGFAGNSRLSTWLHRIAINAALMKFRVLRNFSRTFAVVGRDHAAESKAGRTANLGS